MWRGFCICAAIPKGVSLSTLIVIPARLGATRLPQKPLRLLGGKCLIVRVWERVHGMRVGDRVLVATDSRDVAAVARSAGAEVEMTRDDHPSGTHRVAEVAARPEFSGFDVVVNVQGDEPYINADGILGAASHVERGTFTLGTAACPAGAEVLGDPSVVKVVLDSHDRALYFSRAPIPFLRDHADAAHRLPLVRQHLGVYAYTPEALARWAALPPHPLELCERLEQLRPLADGMAMGVATVGPVTGGGIDTEEDLRIANERWYEKVPSAAGAY